MEYEANRRVESSARTFAIVEHLSRVESAGVSTLADEMGMNKGIIHNHLSTLRELGYVTKVGDSYALSPKLLAVGVRGRSNSPLYQFGGDLIGTFAEQFDVGVIVCRRAGGECVVVDAHDIPGSIDVAVGTDLPLYESLVGLILALNDPEVAVEEVPEYDLDAIRTSLGDRGYVVDRLSRDVAADCIASPVLDDTDTCRGCTGVLLPGGLGSQRRQRISEATVSLRERIEDRFEAGWTEERSFATEKHAWIG